MPITRTSLTHSLTTLTLGLVLVAITLDIAFLVVLAWSVLVVRWAVRETRAKSRKAGVAELSLQFGLMSAIVAGAIWAPCKYEEQVKARHIHLPKETLSIAELSNPEGFPTGRPFRYWLEVPKEMAGTDVRFPSRDLTIGEFIAAIEAQTPLRHRFSSCGNGSSILWGGDCVFGLSLRLPSE